MPEFFSTNPAEALEQAVSNQLESTFRGLKTTAGNIVATLNNPNFFRGLALSVGTAALFKGVTKLNVENFEIGGSQEFVFSQLAAGAKTVIANCEFIYKDPLDLSETNTIKIPICSIDVRMNNKFAKSMPLGAKGEIMEFIGKPSADIEINGLLVNTMIYEDGETPWASRPDIIPLMEMCDQVMEFDLSNGYWGDNEKTKKELNGLVVESYEFLEPKEMKNVQPFRIRAKQSFVPNSTTLFESLT